MKISTIREKMASPGGYLTFALPFWGVVSFIAFSVGAGVVEGVILTAVIIGTGYLPLRWSRTPIRASHAFLIGTTVRLLAFSAAALHAILLNKAPLSWLIAPIISYIVILSIELLFILFQDKKSP